MVIGLFEGKRRTIKFIVVQTQRAGPQTSTASNTAGPPPGYKGSEELRDSVRTSHEHRGHPRQVLHLPNTPLCLPSLGKQSPEIERSSKTSRNLLARSSLDPLIL